MRTVFSGEYNEAMIIRNLLEDRDIEVFTINESMSSIKPWALSAGGSNSLVLNVNDADFEIAIKLIQDYDDGNLDLD